MTGAIGALTVAELGLADELLVAAYGGPSRRKRLASYLALQPDGWVLAWLDGAPAGVGGVMHYGPVAYVGLVGVAPAYRRRGVARAIMAHLLGWLAERGGPVVLLDASASGAPLYEQLGFTDDEKTVVFVQDDCARRPPEPAQVHALAPADPSPQDRSVAAHATQMELQARAELLTQGSQQTAKSRELNGDSNPAIRAYSGADNGSSFNAYA